MRPLGLRVHTHWNTHLANVCKCEKSIKRELAGQRFGDFLQLGKALECEPQYELSTGLLARHTQPCCLHLKAPKC